MLKASKREVILVTLLVVLVAFYARSIAIPTFSDRHVVVAEEKYDYDVGDPGPWFSAWSLGDGQAFAMIALDPTGGKLGSEISESGYRFARAGFGWLVWSLSLGDAEAIPYALGLASALSVLGVLLSAIWLRPTIGPRAWLILVNPALYIGFSADTSEPLGIFFLVVAIGTGAVWAAAALGVTRPTFLIAMIGRWRGLGWGLLSAAVLSVYGIVVFGLQAMIPDGGRVGLPLAAYLEFPTWQGWTLAAVAMATVVWGALKRDLSFVAAGVFILCFGSDVLREPANAWRAAGFLPVLIAFGPGYEATRREAASAVAVAG